MSITPFRARPSAWINLRSPGGVGDTKPVFITLPLSLIEVIICDSGLANNAPFTPGTSMGLAPTRHQPSLPSSPKRAKGQDGPWSMLGKWTMSHKVPPSSSVSQSRPPLWSCVEEKPGSPHVGERRQAGLSRRTLRPRPGWRPPLLGKWHQGVTGPFTGLWSVREHILFPTRCALKRFWKLPELTERLYVGES